MEQRRVRMVEMLLLTALFYFSYTVLEALTSQLWYEGLLRSGFTEEFLEQNGNIPYSLASFAMAFLYYLIYRRLKKRGEQTQPVPDLEEHRRLHGWKAIGISLVLAFGCIGLSTLWMTAVDRVFAEVPFVQNSLETMESAFTEMEEGSYLWSFLYICASGALVEELLFRGLIFHCLERGFLSKGAAIVLSALLFGIWHGIFVQSVYTCLIGLVLGYSYVKTRDLRYPILIHFLNNFMGTLPPQLDTDAVFYGIEAVGVCILPFMFLLMFFLRESPKPRNS